MAGVSSVVFLTLLLCSFSSGSKLAYIPKESGVGSAQFVAQLTLTQDVRGDYDNFVLVVGNPSASTVFENYNPVLNAYFVLVYANQLKMIKVKPSPIFHNYANVLVEDKHIFEVSKDQEEQFIGAVPSYLEIVRVPEARLPAPSLKSFNIPAYDPKIAALIAEVGTDANKEELADFVRYLTGEKGSNIKTRQAQSLGAMEASQWLFDQYTSFGFKAAFQEFREGYAPNVIATLPGKTDPNTLVLVTAHYDSRGPCLSCVTDRAPGANDNGSGTGALLEIAKRIFTSQVSFGFTVVLISFGGEEGGLIGSAYCARQYRALNTSIKAVLNADMIAYRVPTEIAQLGFATGSSTPGLNDLLSSIAKEYVPLLTVGTTGACCTDHASFYNQGYPAASFFERNGGIADPMYHKEGDLVNRDGYDWKLQYPAIVQAIYASLLTVADYQLA